MKTLMGLASSGISGNMMVGALLDKGMPFEVLQKGIEALRLDGYEYICRPADKLGVRGTYFDVVLHDGGADAAHGHTHIHGNHAHTHGHHGDFENSHTHIHGREEVSGAGADEYTHVHSHHSPHRGYTAIKNLIEESSLSAWVKDKAIEAFYRLGMAEAAVHNSTLEAVHFHEVGAVDCIIDIVGTMLGMEYLGADSIRFSPLHVGQGTVVCAHGEMAIPTPATARLLDGLPTYVTPVKGELVTPTGAALVRTLGVWDAVTWTDATIKEQVGMMMSAADAAQIKGVGLGSMDLPIPNVFTLFE